MVELTDRDRAVQLLERMGIEWNEQDEDADILAAEFAAVREAVQCEPRPITDEMVEATLLIISERFVPFRDNRPIIRFALEAAEKARIK